VAGAEVAVAVRDGVAGAEAAVAIRRGVAVGPVAGSCVGEGDATGRGVSLPACGVPVGEDTLVAVDGAVAVGIPPVGAPVGLGEGAVGGSVAEGSGTDVNEGGSVGSRVLGGCVGSVVGGVTGSLGGVGVGMVWLGKAAWADALLPPPQASSRMTSIPSRAKASTRFSTFLPFMAPSSYLGR
jgi:hypothetical protein